MDLFDGPDDFLGDVQPQAAVPPDVVQTVATLRDVAPTDVVATLTSINELDLASLQDAVATLLCRPDVCESSAAVDAILDVLANVGDGRCVRPMEQALVENGSRLSEHQAWRARHIVQKIRRFGRK